MPQSLCAATLTLTAWSSLFGSTAEKQTEKCRDTSTWADYPYALTFIFTLFSPFWTNLLWFINLLFLNLSLLWFLWLVFLSFYPTTSPGDSDTDSEVEDRVDGVKSWLSKSKGSAKNLSDDGSLKSSRSVQRQLLSFQQLIVSSPPRHLNAFRWNGLHDLTQRK